MSYTLIYLLVDEDRSSELRYYRFDSEEKAIERVLEFARLDKEEEEAVRSKTTRRDPRNDDYWIMADEGTVEIKRFDEMLILIPDKERSYGLYIESPYA